MRDDIFISKPNNCHGCPLDDRVPVGFKCGNLCAKIMRGEYEVTYRLDHLGRTICRVEPLRERPS